MVRSVEVVQQPGSQIALKDLQSGQFAEIVDPRDQECGLVFFRSDKNFICLTDPAMSFYVAGKKNTGQGLSGRSARLVQPGETIVITV